jgi:uncharacterized protein YjbI with pentapeptide repeats
VWLPAAAVGALLVVFVVVKLAPQWLASTDGLNASDRAAEIGRVRTALLAMLAGLIAAVGAIYTARTYALNRQGQITERFTRAIEQLGHEQLDVRVGGIFALERIARDSTDDRGPIVEVLTAYVREHAPWPPQSPRAGVTRTAQIDPRDEHAAPAAEPTDDPSQDRRPETDVQAALTVLGRRLRDHEGEVFLDLTSTDLRGARLTGAHLEKAELQGCHLENATLADAHLDKAKLWNAHMQGALLFRAQLKGAGLHGAHLEGAALPDAMLAGAGLHEAHLDGANLEAAHLETAMLPDAHLERAQLARAHLYKAFLRGANLEGANLQGAHLERAELQNAHLEGAELRDAHLQHAKLWDAYLARARLQGARLDDAELQGANLDQAVLEGAVYTAATLWPSGFSPSVARARLAPDETESAM